MPSIDTLARDLYPLSRLSPERLAELREGMHLKTLEAGTFLFRRGESPREIQYVVAGQVELIDAFDREVATLSADQGADPTPLPERLPSCHDARATVETQVLLVDRQHLQVLLDRDRAHPPQSGDGRSARPVAPPRSWRESFLRARGYARVPSPKMEAAVSRMEPVTARAQDIVIRQGEAADYFYVLAEGRCAVLQELADIPEPVKVTEYTVGASLGEDALISGNPRNATVRMLTDGQLMRLPGSDFRELLQPWLARPVGAADAMALLARGARWLDVRLPAESGSRRLPNSLRVPHPVVRARLFNADPAVTYIVVCATQRESPVIAYMLSKYGIDARYLSGGIGAVPAELLA